MASTTPTNIQRVPQLWHAALVSYAMLLIVATHWPGSPPEPGVPQHVPPDKLMHFVAFGGFALLLWANRWLRQWWAVGLVSLAFVVLDEWTQSTFAVNREASGQDIVAGALGVQCQERVAWSSPPLLLLLWLWTCCLHLYQPLPCRPSAPLPFASPPWSALCSALHPHHHPYAHHAHHHHQHHHHHHRRRRCRRHGWRQHARFLHSLHSRRRRSQQQTHLHSTRTARKKKERERGRRGRGEEGGGKARAGKAEKREEGRETRE